MDFPTGEQLENTEVLVDPAPGTEALDLVLWEAIACAKPVIASLLHGIPEAFTEGEHGLLVPPRRSICVVTTSPDVFTLCPWLPV